MKISDPFFHKSERRHLRLGSAKPKPALIAHEAGRRETALRARSRPRERASATRPAWNLISGMIFILGLVVLVHALAYIADTHAPASSTRFLQVDREHISRILENADRIDTLVLGNSHAGSVQVRALGLANGYRYARADGDLFEVAYLLRYLTPRLENMKVALIPISYFSFREENPGSGEVEIRRAHLYASLPSWQALPGDWEAFLIGKSHIYLPVPRLLREDNWEGVFYALLGQEPEEDDFIEVEVGDCSYLNPEQLAASVENRVGKYMRLTREMSANNPDLSEDVYNSLVQTTRYLRRQGVRVIYFTPPYWQGYTRRYLEQDPQTIQHMQARMASLQQELGVEYYDFSQDPEFASNPNLYKDSDHLNSCGAERFSRKLGRAINHRQAIQP